MKKINFFTLLFIGGLLWIQTSQTSCTNDKLPEPISNPVCDTLQVAYDLQVKTIIDASCAFVGCHSAGAAFGDYTSYDQMLPFLNDNEFKKRVLDLRDMPPDGDTLSAMDFETLECWVTQEYPETFTNVTYDFQIKSIIDVSCAIPGCHNANSAFGDYTSYDEMLPILNDDGFKNRVIDIMDMPDGDMLSTQDFELVKQWVMQGYPEN